MGNGKRSLTLIKKFSFIVFWCLIMPLGFFRKLLGLSKFNKSIRKTDTTYWNHRNAEEIPAKRYRQQY